MEEYSEYMVVGMVATDSGKKKGRGKEGGWLQDMGKGDSCA